MTKKTKSSRSFNEEFKTQIIQLYLNGKRKCEIIREYDLSPSNLSNWIKQFDNTGYFKANGVDFGTKANSYKYKTKNGSSFLIEEFFEKSRKNYWTRRIKHELPKLGYKVSKRRISTIMKLKGLASKYTISKFKSHHNKVNEEKLTNLVERNFNKQDYLQVVVSNLTYVSAGKS